MGSAVSADLVLPDSSAEGQANQSLSTPLVGLRGEIPSNLLHVNKTAMEEPARRLLYPDERRVGLETGKPHTSRRNQSLARK